MSRTQNAVKNIFFAISSKILTLLVSFVSRTIFIQYLGSTYLGINGLFTEVLSLLSFAELGFGTALNFALYQPVASGNQEKIQKLLDYYKKIYRIIAMIICSLGLALVPFLQYLVKGAEGVELSQLRVYYVFFLANTVVGYFVSYKYSLVNAEQKNYITTNFEFISNLVIVIMQTITIVITKDYLAYLVVHTGVLIGSRFVLSIYLNKQFPVLKEKVVIPLSKEEKGPIYTEVKGLILHQFASVAIHQTDNIIISSLTGMGVIAVGYISNYNMLMSAVTSIVVLIFNSIVSGFGNLIVASTKENFKRVFTELNFINFWIYGFCAIAFYSLIPPFIELWLGSQYLIDDISFLLIVLNSYFVGQSVIYNSARTAYGNFNSDKWVSLIQALINLIASVIGAKTLGLVGVYIGTILSRTWFVIMRPYKTYELMFEESVKKYYGQFIKHLGAVFAVGLITKSFLNIFVPKVTVLKFVFMMGIVMILPNILFFLLYSKTEEFSYAMERIKNILYIARNTNKERKKHD